MTVSIGRRPVLTAVLTILFAVAAGTAGMFLLSWTASRPRNLGVRNDRLAACPGSPNCVSTQAEDREHWIAPIAVPASVASPIELMAEVVRNHPRTVIVEQTSQYLRVEFRTPFFRFCDDVEFYFESESRRIHFRSASRVGYSDLGLNRTRMEEVRQAFLRAMPESSAGQDGVKAVPVLPFVLCEN